MAYLGSSRPTNRHRPVPLTKLRRPLAILAGLVTASIVLLVWLLPPPLVLPVFGMLSLAAAAVSAVVAWRGHADRDVEGFSAWDAAGAFAFIGFAATLLSEPEHVLELLR